MLNLKIYILGIILILVSIPLVQSDTDILDTGVLESNEVNIRRSGEQLELFIDEPPSPRGEKVIAFHNGNIIDGIGIIGSGTWEASIRITPDELVPYDGWDLIGVRFYHWEPGTQSGDLKIYDEGINTSPGNLITSESYNVSGTGWKRINLTNPAPLNITKDIWTSILMNQLVGDYPMGVDYGPAVDGKGDWVCLGGDWYELQHFGFDNNLCIEAIISSPDHPPYLEISIVPTGCRIRATIWNHGCGVAEDTSWNITIDGGLLFNGREFSDLIDKIPIGAYENVASNLIFGIGKVSITIKATPSNGEEIVLKTNGFVLGPLYICF